MIEFLAYRVNFTLEYGWMVEGMTVMNGWEVLQWGFAGYSEAATLVERFEYEDKRMADIIAGKVDW